VEFDSRLDRYPKLVKGESKVVWEWQGREELIASAIIIIAVATVIVCHCFRCDHYQWVFLLFSYIFLAQTSLYIFARFSHLVYCVKN